MSYLPAVAFAVALVVSIPAGPDAARLEAAEQGNAEAQFEIGRDCMLGVDVKLDMAAGRKWLYEAARSGHGTAQDYFGIGRGMGSKGRNRLRKTAKKGDPLAQFFLAERLTVFAPEYDSEVFKWYRMAAEGGLPAAKLTLARMYLTGEGVAQDGKEGERWLRDAASVTERAYALLGDLYFSSGLEGGPEEAARWYLKAAEQGDPFAQMMLGVMYAEGKGVARNLVEALSWLDVASRSGAFEEQGFAAVLAVLQRGVAERMTNEEIERATRLAAERRAPE